MDVGPHARGLGAGMVILAGFVVFELRRRPRCSTRGSSPAGACPPAACRSSCSSSPCSALSSSSCSTCSSSVATPGWSRRSACCRWPPHDALRPAGPGAGRPAGRQDGLRRRAGCSWPRPLSCWPSSTSTSSYWLLAAGLIPLGAGMGLAMTPATSGITAALPAAQQGVGSAINDLSREVGGAVGIAVLAGVLTSTYQSHLNLRPTMCPPAAGGPGPSLGRHRLPPGRGRCRPGGAPPFADGLHLALLHHGQDGRRGRHRGRHAAARDGR